MILSVTEPKETKKWHFTMSSYVLVMVKKNIGLSCFPVIFLTYHVLVKPGDRYRSKEFQCRCSTFAIA